MHELRTIANGLLKTSAEIESRALVTRPRFMAAAWGGLIVCKVAATPIIGAESTLPLLAATLAGGAALVWLRFRPRLVEAPLAA